MNIERIYSKKKSEQMPGLVEMFIGQGAATGIKLPITLDNIAIHFGQDIISALAEYDIHLGTTYGAKGIELNDFLDLPHMPDNTVFELCAETYRRLPKATRLKIKEREHNVVLQDYMQVLYEKNRIDFKTIKGTADGIPIWILATLADHIQNNNIPDTLVLSQNPKLASVLINKPRKFRLDMLEQLYQHNLLDRCEWSMCVILPPNVDNAKRMLMNNKHPFVIRHMDQLPRYTSTINNYGDCVQLPEQYHGQFKWMICCETYDDVPFVTEKTIKAFISGAVPLTVAPPGFNKLLEDMGFCFPGDYDHLSGIERIKEICNILENDHNNYEECVQQNFALISDKHKIVNLIAQRIQEQFN